MKKLLSVFIFSLLLVMLTACGGEPDPDSQAESELSMLDNHYNEIMTDIGNLNTTGHGDFVNMMNDQIDFASASINDLDDKFGNDSPRINLCKEAWEKLTAICIASRDAIKDNDQSKALTVPIFEQEYKDLINQIENYQTTESEESTN